MEFIRKHIFQLLRQFISQDRDVNFLEIINQMKAENDEIYESILIYIQKIIKEFKLIPQQNLNVLHIHFENEYDDKKSELYLIFILIVLFENSYFNDKVAQIESVPNKIFSTLNLKKKILKTWPAGASKKNRIAKKWELDRKINNSLLRFYDNYKYSTLIPKSIINIPVKTSNNISDFLLKSPFAVFVENYPEKKSYNILNTNCTINELDRYDGLIDNIESILIFDCDRKKVMLSYSLEEIKKWNSDYETKFNDYLIITFGKDSHSLNNIRNKIETIREKFKIPSETTYTILASEIDFLQERNEKSSTSIELIGFETSSFWDTFLLETSIREFYELRSLKLKNIYSICFTDEIKRYILIDLFSKSESSELISTSTKMAILELGDEDIDVLKEALSNTLDLIINSEIKSRIIESLRTNPTIIFDESIIRNAKLIAKVINAFGLTRAVKLKTWSDLQNPSSNNFLILSYRDQGKYPNYFYPNLLEMEYPTETTSNAILSNFLFGHQYKWSKYLLLKEYHKYLNHPIRENYFEWTKLKNTIQSLKPEKKLSIDWNLENEFSNSDQRESFKIKIKNQKSKTFNSSDLFIVADENNILKKVIKIDFLMSLESDDGKVFIQNLDEIQENINIYEKIVDKKQQEAELNVIRKQFHLGDESAGRLWKILLKNKADIDGEEKLYGKLKNYFESKGLKIVSQFHFKNSWINPQSESIAPLSKRVFIELCEYLQIPKIYFVIIQRIRNASKQSSRQSTRQMNQLLKDLFNDGCFDIGKNARDIINNKLSFYKSNHPLDELGIDENYLADNLVALTELIQPELKLLELETIEKIKQ